MVDAIQPITAAAAAERVRHRTGRVGGIMRDVDLPAGVIMGLRISLALETWVLVFDWIA